MRGHNGRVGLLVINKGMACGDWGLWVTLTLHRLGLMTTDSGYALGKDLQVVDDAFSGWLGIAPVPLGGWIAC